MELDQNFVPPIEDTEGISDERIMELEKPPSPSLASKVWAFIKRLEGDKNKDRIRRELSLFLIRNYVEIDELQGSGRFEGDENKDRIRRELRLFLFRNYVEIDELQGSGRNEKLWRRIKNLNESLKRYRPGFRLRSELAYRNINQGTRSMKRRCVVGSYLEEVDEYVMVEEGDVMVEVEAFRDQYLEVFSMLEELEENLSDMELSIGERPEGIHEQILDIEEGYRQVLELGFPELMERLQAIKQSVLEIINDEDSIVEEEPVEYFETSMQKRYKMPNPRNITVEMTDVLEERLIGLEKELQSTLQNIKENMESDPEYIPDEEDIRTIYRRKLKAPILLAEDNREFIEGWDSISMLWSEILSEIDKRQGRPTA